MLDLGKAVFGWRATRRSRQVPSDAVPSERDFIQNGARLFEVLIASCRGDTNPIRMFSAREIMEATGNYGRLLGSGISLVYGGVHDGRPIAVKRGVAHPRHGAGYLFDMFLNEVASLSQINHRNVVRLLGCCIETRVPILVYELVSGGTLYQHIHSTDASRRIPWADRLRIALEVADALNYLHTALRTPIVHGNVQSSSIFLDDRYSAKVGTFGFSELVSSEGMSERKGLWGSGSHGNSDPEYDFGLSMTGASDVFGFGLVLIELLTGKEPSDAFYEGTRSICLEHFISSTQENLLGSVLDGSVLSEADPAQLVACARVAVRSVTWDVEQRPTMKELVQELRRIMRTNVTKNAEHLFDASSELV